MEANEAIEMLEKFTDTLIEEDDLCIEKGEVEKAQKKKYKAYCKATEEDTNRKIKELQNSTNLPSPNMPIFVNELPRLKKQLMSWFYDDSYKNCPNLFTDYIYLLSDISGGNYFDIEKGDSFVSDCQNFEAKYLAYHDAAHTVRKEAIAKIESQKKKISQDCEDKIKEINRKIETVKQERTKYDIIDEDYHFLAYDVLAILKSQRANNLTDALNLAIKENNEEEYREEQLRIQVEEANERNRILQQQADEERRSNERLEQMENERLRQERAAYNGMVAAMEESNRMQAHQYYVAANAAKKAEMQAKSAARQAKWDEDRRKSDFNRAQQKYDTASFRCRNAQKSGNTGAAARYARDMDHYAAEMLKHKK